ncbi:MAG: CDP-diacylglycerol--serine O-phosphatidyltransferase [Archaeoglobaceae archaeon]|nr:CDP-diacylglycerol--serine O-phosphatidyltransferase [Archaeoglobaceae archaeon]MDW7989178.1 CDP-diacylglycerol--serine O-phosphatidyltransferase [Archaeoglobaceae archaeon]
MKIFKEVSLADSLSVLNALLGFSALAHAVYDFEKSFKFFYLSLIADGLDGWVASKTEKSKLGKELDSLADTVSFSLYPAFIIFLKDEKLFVFSSILLAFSILRLARFNVLNSRNFLGVPTSINAIFLTSLVRIGMSFEVLAICVLFFSVLMISDLEYRRIEGVPLIPLGLLLLLAILFVEICYVLIALSLIYIIYPGVKTCEKLLQHLRRV